MILTFDHLQGALILDDSFKRPVQKVQRLHGLTQIVAGGCKKRGIGLVCAVRCLFSRPNLSFHALTFRHVPDNAGYE